MNKIIKRTLGFTLLLSIFNLPSFAQVTFQEMEWNALLSAAKKEGKYVFVDAYTDWCGWCKVMDEKTFSQPEVGAVMNSKLVCTKIEMEKTEIGKKLSMKYGISSFPTFLIFDGEGILIGKLSGYSAPEPFLESLQEALLRENHLIQPGYSKGFNQKYPTIYKDAFAENGKRKFPDSTAMTTFMKKEKDLSKEVPWAVVNRFVFMLTPSDMDKVQNQKMQIQHNFGIDAYESFVINYADSKLYKSIKTKDQQQLTEVETLLKQNLRNPEKVLPFFQLAFYKGVQNWIEMVDIIDAMLKESTTVNLEFINSYAWDIYEKCDDKTVISKAINWMKPLITEESDYAYLDTYASLLFKNGDFQEASNWAKIAIQVGQKAGAEVTATEELLVRIQEEME